MNMSQITLMRAMPLGPADEMTQLLSFDVDQVMGGDKSTMAITLFFDTDLDRPVIKGLQICHGLISVDRQFDFDWTDHGGNRDRCLSPERS